MNTQSTIATGESRLPGRVVAGVAVVLGLVFVLNPLYLYTNAEQLTEFSIFLRFINAALLLYGLILLAAGWYGRHGDAPTILGGLVGLGLLLALTGPIGILPFPVLVWAATAVALTIVLGIPGVWAVRRAARTSTA